MRIGRAARASVTARSGAAATSSAESGTRSQTGTTAGLASSCVVPSCAVLSVCEPEAGPVAVFDVDVASGDVRLLATFAGTNLAEGGELAYSPDGSLLAV